MRAVVVEKPETATVLDVPRPTPGPGEVVVQVAACGICGTDKHIYAGSFLSHYPLTPGHEFAGVVSDIGPGVHEVREGDRVAVDPSLFCGECYYCRKLQGNHCVRWGAIGDTTNGAFAEYVKVPARNCYKLSDSLSFEEAAVIEPLSCVAWGQKRLQAQPGDSVLLLGAGPMSLLWTQMLRHGNASQIVVTDLHEPRLAMARGLGASATVPAGEGQAERLHELAPHGFDVVIDVTGIPAVLQSGFDYVAPMGKVMVFGVCPLKSTITVEPFQVYNKDLTILGSMALNYTFLPAIAMLESGVVDVKPMLTHRLPLEDFTHALSLAGSRESMKVQIAPQS
ncbi:MAG: zinc-dependent alcohol dehydrogenase family protein [Chloroflexota bacterium]|nr:zinc-dependent alcohol dehydrogenase family protein [Chloroflexota bacterium]